MTDKRFRGAPKKIVIVGGGTAGWMAAAFVAKTTQGRLGEIHVVESEQIGTIGVGEATIPYILDFNRILGIDEAEFIRQTKATFKLGIEFRDWTRLGHTYLHPFGTIGAPFGRTAFQHFLTKRALAGTVEDLEAYSLCSAAARRNSFAPTAGRRDGVFSTFGYAYHFDAGLYAAFLRSYAEKAGVKRHEGRIVEVGQNPDSGFVTAVTLENGEAIDGDLFLDCSGLAGLLIGKTLGTGFEDWSQWLPCNRAAFVPSQRVEPLTPYTRATAKSAGWQWRIPLQHRIGNGYVFSSDFTDDETAAASLLDGLDSERLAEPRFLRFTTGRREAFWVKNVVALGLSGGFLEPLESTSIHLIHSGLIKLADLWPTGDFNPLVSEQYNRAVGAEYETIRDFLILHYKATQRDDSAFWNYCRGMDVPDSLTYRLEHFRSSGRIILTRGDLFQPPSWLAVMLGQGILPQGYDPMADIVPDAVVEAQFESMRTTIAQTARALPTHEEVIARIVAQRA